MIETKEYVIAMLGVLDRIECFSTIELIQMGDGFSQFWAPIFDEFKAKRVISDGTIKGFPVNKPYISLLRAEYKQKLKKIEEDEEDRKLNNAHKRAEIKRIRRAEITAWLSLIISILAIIAQIIF